ncbi:hypothetical protein [Streptomyces beijiangensis]|uniref:Uncharacterized protein n=1 Tax=Streptomyces beijiangensis TaxID=163361 RepID=A0A939FA54_9ACTN|nr:hypothetical protein [Streptomyces beijiangensis]MBO0514768.1 hypothetical protein [Streptomyces beijiangensis]
MVGLATEHTVRALGVVRPLDIEQYFLRGKYDGLPQVLRTLTDQSRASGRGAPPCCRRSAT